MRLLEGELLLLGSQQVLGGILVVSLFLVLFAPLHTLLLLDIGTSPIQVGSALGGVLVDPTDLIFGILLLGLVLRGGISFRSVRANVPFFWLWVLLGVLLCSAYVHSPTNRDYLTAAHRIVYQLYRGGWKPILYFPLVALLFRDAHRGRRALSALMVAGVLFSVMGLLQFHQGQSVSGPFRSGNALGGVLVVPFLVALARIINPTSKADRLLAIASLLMMGRVLLYTGSRGGYVGLLAGSIVLFWQLFRRSAGRNRIFRLFPAAATIMLLVLVMKPDLLERPTVRRFLTISEPMEQETMQWRFEQRWPMYWELAKASPWLGYGTDVAPQLQKGSGAVTPHNGYLSLALIYGFPATALFILFSVIGIRSGMILSGRDPLSAEGTIGAAVAAGIVAILVHNAADSMMTLQFVGKTFWLLVGLGVVILRGQEDEATDSASAPVPGERIETATSGRP